MKRRYRGPRDSSITITVDGNRVRLKGSYVAEFYTALKAGFPSWSYDPEKFTWSVSAADLEAIKKLACRHCDRVTVYEGSVGRQVKPYSWM